MTALHFRDSPADVFCSPRNFLSVKMKTLRRKTLLTSDDGRQASLLMFFATSIITFVIIVIFLQMSIVFTKKMRPSPESAFLSFFLCQSDKSAHTIAVRRKLYVLLSLYLPCTDKRAKRQERPVVKRRIRTASTSAESAVAARLRLCAASFFIFGAARPFRLAAKRPVLRASVPLFYKREL